MLINFDEFYKNKFNKLKERTRKGVPDSLRGLIWQVLADINVYRNEEKNQNGEEQILFNIIGKIKI